MPEEEHDQELTRKREGEPPQGEPPVPHLADPASMAVLAVWLAKWIVAAVAGGGLGGAAFDAVKAVRKRFGRRKVEELEKKIFEELKKVKRKPNVSNRDLELRVRQLMDSAGL